MKYVSISIKIKYYESGQWNFERGSDSDKWGSGAAIICFDAYFSDYRILLADRKAKHFQTYEQFKKSKEYRELINEVMSLVLRQSLEMESCELNQLLNQVGIEKISRELKCQNPKLLSSTKWL